MANFFTLLEDNAQPNPPNYKMDSKPQSFLDFEAFLTFLDWMVRAALQLCN